ncbi:hypothetical protein GVAV_001021 [Gurleya vavrai]
MNKERFDNIAKKLKLQESTSNMIETKILLNLNEQLFEYKMLLKSNLVLKNLKEYTESKAKMFKTKMYKDFCSKESENFIILKSFDNDFEKSIFYTIIKIINMTNIDKNKNQTHLIFFIFLYVMDFYFFICSRNIKGRRFTNFYDDFIKICNSKDFAVKIIKTTLSNHESILKDIKMYSGMKSMIGLLKKLFLYAETNSLNLLAKNLEVVNDTKKLAKKLQSFNPYVILEFKSLIEMSIVKVFFEFHHAIDYEKLNLSCDLPKDNEKDVSFDKEMQSYAILKKIDNKIILKQSIPGIKSMFAFYDEVLSKHVNFHHEHELEFFFNINFNDQIIKSLNYIVLEYINQNDFDDFSGYVMTQRIKFLLLWPLLKPVKIITETDYQVNRSKYNIIINRNFKYDICSNIKFLKDDHKKFIDIGKFEAVVQNLIESFFNILIFKIYFHDETTFRNYLCIFNKNSTDAFKTKTKNDLKILWDFFKEHLNAKVDELKNFFQDIKSQHLEDLNSKKTAISLLKTCILLNINSNHNSQSTNEVKNDKKRKTVIKNCDNEKNKKKLKLQ